MRELLNDVLEPHKSECCCGPSLMSWKTTRMPSDEVHAEFQHPVRLCPVQGTCWLLVISEHAEGSEQHILVAVEGDDFGFGRRELGLHTCELCLQSIPAQRKYTYMF